MEVDSEASEVDMTQSPSSLDDVPPSHHEEDEDNAQEDRSTLLKGTILSATQPDKAHGSPWYAWPLLGASLLAVSSAAVVFASIPDVPTFTLAAWRLQLTTLLLTPAAIHQYRQLTTGGMPCFDCSSFPSSVCNYQSSYANIRMLADETRRLWKDVLLILASGAFLAVHFSCWVWVSPTVFSCYYKHPLGLTFALNAAISISYITIDAVDVVIPLCTR